MRPEKLMTRLINVVAISLCVAACAANPNARKGPAADTPYEAADAGYLVYAVGTVRGFGMRFSFPYTRVETPDGESIEDWRGRIRPHVGGAIYLTVQQPDFEGFETGHVVTRPLPAGKFAITDFEFFGSGIAGSYEWNSAVPFTMEFDIQPGRATYIGSFMRSLTPDGYQQALGAAGYFLVSNRASRDVPIAISRLPDSVSVVEQVTDVDQFDSIVLRSKALEPETP